MPNLIWLFTIPFIASFIAFLIPISRSSLKSLAVLMSLFPLTMLLAGQWIGAQVDYAWIPPLAIHFHLSIDSLSLLFLYLVAIIIPVTLLTVHAEELPFLNTFYGLVLLLQGLLIGFFTARDLVVFAIFWEAMLLPLYLVIVLWGGDQRRLAALKFLIYMLAGSVLMVAAILALYFAAGSVQGTANFNLDLLAKVSEIVPYAPWLAAIFFLAFAVKTPLFPFHAWLPDAYYEAPTAGSILLSALLSKAGVYGFLRIGMELFPTLLREWSPLLLGLAIAGVFYGGLAAWAQTDFKRLIAYSSFSHINFVLAGVFIWNQAAHGGAILQALNHGITIAALFIVAGWLEDRLGSTAIGRFSGVAKQLPQLCWLTLFFVLSSVALPGLNNFIGEFMILFGLFGKNQWLAAFLGLTVVLTVLYMLRWMQKIYFEAPHFEHEIGTDIKRKEMAIVLPLIALIVWIGVYPTPVLKQVGSATENIAAIGKRVEEPQ